jgi:hypothetical protein
MARIAVLDPDDNPPDGTTFAPSAAARARLLAELTGRRLEVRRDGADLLARLTPASRLDRVMAWLHRTLRRQRD